MLISRAPFRISYVGGGTDFEDYYKYGYGNVISTAIDKFIYVTINKKFDHKIYVRYSQRECVNRVADLKHSIVREVLKLHNIENSIEIVTISDVPSAGSGLGSSSSLTAALLAGMARFQGNELSKYELAEKTCDFEIKLLQQPIGKQDQFAVCFGGLNLITFAANGIIDVLNLTESSDQNRLTWLKSATMLFYLNNGRKSGDILHSHKSSIETKCNVLDRQRDLVGYFKRWLEGDYNIAYAGKLVSDSWMLKKAITPQASNDDIDSIIYSALQAGACGAKVCGAGSGGFMMVICDPQKQDAVRDTLNVLHELVFNFEPNGVDVIFES